MIIKVLDEKNTDILKSIDFLRRISYKATPEYTLLELINQSIQFLFINDKDVVYNALVSLVVTKDILGNEITQPIQSEIVIYQTEDGNTKLDVKFQDETVWLTQAQLCELYQTSKSNISEHIKHIFEEGELEEGSVVRKFRTTGADGKNYNIIHYNLDMIISLGYRPLCDQCGL